VADDGDRDARGRLVFLIQKEAPEHRFDAEQWEEGCRRDVGSDGDGVSAPPERHRAGEAERGHVRERWERGQIAVRDPVRVRTLRCRLTRAVAHDLQAYNVLRIDHVRRRRQQ